MTPRWLVHRRSLKAHAFVSTKELALCGSMHKDKDKHPFRVGKKDKCKMCLRFVLRLERASK